FISALICTAASERKPTIRHCIKGGRHFGEGVGVQKLQEASTLHVHRLPSIPCSHASSARKESAIPCPKNSGVTGHPNQSKYPSIPRCIALHPINHILDESYVFGSADLPSGFVP
ncbi:extracellular triacylglycerol lipase precursor, partial [Moniliophthora roreri]